LLLLLLLLLVVVVVVVVLLLLLLVVVVLPDTASQAVQLLAWGIQAPADDRLSPSDQRLSPDRGLQFKGQHHLDCSGALLLLNPPSVVSHNPYFCQQALPAHGLG
jgi:hypothetical protein